MKKNRKLATWALVLVMLLQLSPMAMFAYASSDTKEPPPPPKMPLEQVIAKSGAWQTDLFTFEGVDSLSYYYNGPHTINYDGVAETLDEDVVSRQATAKFTLKKDFVLSKIGTEYVFDIDTLNPDGSLGTVPMSVTAYLQHAETGNAYGPFVLVGFGGVDLKAFQEGTLENVPMAFASRPKGSEIPLKKGTYYLYLDHLENYVVNSSTGSNGAFVVIGRSDDAMKKYYKDYLEWELKALEVDEDVEASIEGNEALDEAVNDDGDMTYDEGWEDNPPVQSPHLLSVREPLRISEIGINTSRLQTLGSATETAGNPAQSLTTPGSFTIMNEQGQVVYESQAGGYTLDGVANGLALTQPMTVLAPGNYQIAYSKPETIMSTPEGKPDLYIKTEPAEMPNLTVSGTYQMDISAFKTSTLFGSTDGTEKSFSLTNHEIAVIDGGDQLQLTTKYDGMPFAILATVTMRTSDYVEADLQFSTDLRNTPMKASISTNDQIRIEKTNNTLRVTVNGQATYQRAATKEKGADLNTYRVEANGYRRSEILPPYVVTALKRAGVNAGRIPGPDNPGQLAIGILFPSAVGLIAHIAQQAFEQTQKMPFSKGKTSLDDEAKGHRPLSVGEQAMKDANNSLGKGLVDEREASAWKILAEAMGNTDEPDEGDRVSIGDNEVVDQSYASDDYDQTDYDEGFEQPSTDASDDPYEEANEGPFDAYQDDLPEAELSEVEALEKEKEEWILNLKSSKESAEDSERSDELHKEYEDYIEHLETRINDLNNPLRDPITMDVQVDHTGRKETIIYNEDTDEWVVESSGNPFNMTSYEKDVLPGFEDTNQFIKEQRKKFAERDTAFDRYLDEEKAKEVAKQKLMDKLIKERKKSFEIAPPEDGLGRVGLKYEDIIDKLSRGEISYEEAQQERKKAFNVLNGRVTGRTMSEREASDIAAQDTFVNASIESAKLTAEEVVTGDTKLGMAGRIMIAVGTGGASEFVLAPAEALVDMKRMVDSDFTEKAKKFLKSKGVNIDGMSETEIVGLLAVGKFVLGEAAGEGAGYAAQGAGKAFKVLVKSELGEKGAKEFFDFVGGKVSKAVTKVVDVGNTPVTKVMKNLKEGAENKLKDTVDTLTGKKALKEMAETEKLLKDQIDYNKYRSKVKAETSALEGKLKSGQELNEAELASSLRDTGVSRELKKADPDVQDAFAKQMDEKFYKPANQDTIMELKKDKSLVKEIEGLSEAEYEIDLVQIRTPKQEGKWSSPVNADNDVFGRVKIYDKDAAGKIKLNADGEPLVKKYVEVPAEKVEKIYQEKFAERTGYLKDGKFDVDRAARDMPEGIDVVNPKTGKTEKISWKEASQEQRIKAVSDKHNQEVTDLKNVESAKDFSNFRNDKHVSNVKMMKDGKYGKMLEDANELANMEYSKVKKFLNRGDTMNSAEGMIQTGKLSKLTGELNEAYRKAGYDVKPLPKEFQAAIDVVNNDALSPLARNKELNKLGFADATDLANKCTSQIEHLKNAKPGQMAKTAQVPTVDLPTTGGKVSIGKAVVRRIVKSELGERGGNS